MSQIYNFKINYHDVLIRMGANKFKTRIDEKTESLITESIENVQKILQPKYAISYTDKKIENNKIIIENFIIESKDIIKLLEKSEIICGFVATVGHAIDIKIDLLQKQDKALAYIYDSIGSVAIEQLVDNINDEIKKSNSGYTLTRRFSVGYGDWKIENQKPFLVWLGADKIGITLSDTFQMNPMKSVSAILGLEK
ncbi:MAG: hypothetical protein PHR82_05065 [Endomicrobiaceae bacterium]|nr:hypothetical protein [Endomicrobiaceae bacterium]